MVEEGTVPQETGCYFQDWHMISAEQWRSPAVAHVHGHSFAGSLRPDKRPTNIVTLDALLIAIFANLFALLHLHPAP